MLRAGAVWNINTNTKYIFVTQVKHDKRVEFVSDGSSFVAMLVAPESMNRARSPCIVKRAGCGLEMGVGVYLDCSMVRLRNNH